MKFLNPNFFFYPILQGVFFISYKIFNCFRLPLIMVDGCLLLALTEQE